MNAGSLGSLGRGTGGEVGYYIYIYIETRWAQEVVERQVGGSLDIETNLRCMQQVVKGI